MIADHHAGAAARRWSARAGGEDQAWTIVNAIVLTAAISVGASLPEPSADHWIEVVAQPLYVGVGFAALVTAEWWQRRRRARRDVVHEQLRWGPWAVDGTAGPAQTTAVDGWLRALWPILLLIAAALGLIPWAAWRGALTPALLAVAGVVLVLVWYRLQSRWKRALTLDTGREPWRPGERRTAVLRVEEDAPPMALLHVHVRVVRDIPAGHSAPVHRDVAKLCGPVEPPPTALAGGEVFELTFDLPSAAGTRHDSKRGIWWELRLEGEWNGRTLEWYFLLPVFDEPAATPKTEADSTTGARVTAAT